MTQRPIGFFERLLARLHKERDRESLLADFEEIYQDIQAERGRASANIWYLKQVLTSIPPVLGNKLYWFSLTLSFEVLEFVG